MVPHLITALSGPVTALEQRILDSTPAIERWFRLEWMEHTPPFYGAVNIRNAGFKLAPVDTNLYPGGWNNLSPEMMPLAVQAAMAAIEKICPEARNLLVVPEHQPRNSFYLANLLQLRRIFHQAGLNVRFGSLSPEIERPTVLNLPTGEIITLEPLVRTERRLGLQDFDPCTILLNTNLARGVPGMVEDLHEQYLLPPLHGSGSLRRQSTHFKIYDELAKRFAKLLGIDPWLITPLYATCSAMTRGQAPVMTDLAEHVDALLSRIKRKYKEYGIAEKAFVVVKADRGGHASHGVGLMAVRDAKELHKLTLPDHVQKTELVVQEGVQTHERVNEAVAEPVVYTMDRYVVGGFYRVHAERGVDENLNAPGSRFVPLAFADHGRLPKASSSAGASSPNRFYMYGVMARLALLGASYELEASDPNAESDE